MGLGRLVWLCDEPPVGVHGVMGHSLVAKTDVFPVGPHDEELLVTDGLEDLLVKDHGGLVVVRMDAHLRVIDHVGVSQDEICRLIEFG